MSSKRQIPLRFVLPLLAVVVAAAGCKSVSLSSYVSPRVVGRVLDSQSRQPIEHANVRRISSDESYRSLEPPKGGQLMEQAPGVVSGKDGQFDLDSVRALTPFAKGGWYSVTVRFDHPDYGRCTVTYTILNATNTPTGEPLVNANDVLLIPRAK